MTKETKEHGNSKPFNWEVFDAIIQFKVTKIFCAQYMGISADTIERRLRAERDMTFTEYQESKMAGVSIKLQTKALEMALGGHPVMMIFALKNISGWSDKVEQTVKELPPIKLAYKK